jgi:uncharacterized protein
VQAAGFLRIRNGENPLDASAVHPESYAIVDRMAEDLGCSVADLMQDESLRERIDPARYVTKEIGLPTLNDIVAELARPGRDPRERFEAFRFAEGIEKLEDLTPGMKLPGIVTNLTAFGAFVDIGVHQDGLVHLSQIADRFVKDPGEVLKVRQAVEVTVLAVDLERKRISLTLKKEPERRGKPANLTMGSEHNQERPAGETGLPQKASGETPAESFAQGEKRAAGKGPARTPTSAGEPGERSPQRSGSPRERQENSRPQRIKPREEKVPFNNPFAAVFGKK